MDTLRISLFRRFNIQCVEQPLVGCQAYKVQELLCYLLLHRDKSHARETLASLLWGGHCTTAQSKKYLRNALWQLQTALNTCQGRVGQCLIQVKSDWIQINAMAEFWLDVTVFEDAYRRVRGMPGEQLDAETAKILQDGVEVYVGDLLDGWYQDWCLCERERFQQIYLIMLDKLIDYCERTRDYEAGILYGEASLRCDRARERTYQHVMRLHYADGDRTGALRQYERCLTNLREELDVAPSRRTTLLYDLIRADQAAAIDEFAVVQKLPPSTAAPSVLERLNHIIHLQHQLAAVQAQIQREIEAVELVLLQERSQWDV